jgi:hypothetical protein
MALFVFWHSESRSQSVLALAALNLLSGALGLAIWAWRSAALRR